MKLSQEDASRIMYAAEKMAQKYAPAAASIALGHPNKKMIAAYGEAKAALEKIVSDLTDSEGL